MDEYPIEAAWRRLLAEDCTRVRSSLADPFAGLVCQIIGRYAPILLHTGPSPELLGVFLQPTGHQNLPSGVVLPSQLARRLIIFGEGKGRAQDEIKEIRQAAYLVANTLHVWAIPPEESRL
jgi:hypothetical protein